MSEKVICGIYQIKNKINGKSYIGQSYNIYNRWKQHKRVINDGSNSVMKEYPFYQALKKYGIENFDFIILEECPAEQLNEREKFWIMKLNTYINAENSQGYNLTVGGDGVSTITTQQEEEITNLWNQNFTITEISQQLKITGDSVSRVLYKIFPNITERERKERGYLLAAEKTSHPVFEYDCFGHLTNKYPSVREAARILNIDPQNLQRCIWGKIATYKNHFYIYATDNQQESLIKLMRLAQSKPIIQIDNQTKIPIAIFYNITEASEIINPNNITAGRTSIGNCVRHRSKTSYGYQWQFLVEYLEENNFNYDKINILINNCINKGERINE